MVILAFVHLVKVGRQPFAAKQGVNACRLQTPPVGMGMPTYEKLRHPVGRQPFAADEGGKRPGNPCRIVQHGDADLCCGMSETVGTLCKPTQNFEEPIILPVAPAGYRAPPAAAQWR